ncbi:SDR family oxidoreductase [Nocardia acidivorans]|uniref:SDR family oxidoreductase n=1 Tax=Nocardia acidivorans TaxID=404580 RepID=UPI00082CFC20|nr:SDR family oxidoreductase [Nocardia acidivorans]
MPEHDGFGVEVAEEGATADARLGGELFHRGLFEALVGEHAISPGSTDTPILAESARLYDQSGPDASAAQQPLGRLPDPAEIAAAPAFLASPAAGGITGAVIPVDGGPAL